MFKYLLDTNICIYTIKNRPDQVRDAFTRHHEQLCISSITVMELIFGAENSAVPESNMTVLEGFLARLKVVDYDQQAARHTGQLRAELRKRGTPIGPYDQMIVGHARSLGLTLVTHNEREFARVPGLRIVNWVHSPS